MTVTPDEAHSPLIVDSYAPLPRTIAAEFLQSVRWWNGQVVESCSGVQHAQLAKGDALKIARQLTGAPQREELLGLAVRPGTYHLRRNSNALRY